LLAKIIWAETEFADYSILNLQSIVNMVYLTRGSNISSKILRLTQASNQRSTPDEHSYPKLNAEANCGCVLPVLIHISVSIQHVNVAVSVCTRHLSAC